MSPLWRGFAGLVTVFLLAYFVTDLEKKTKEEKAMLSKDPAGEAQRAFNKKKFAFYESWHRQYDENGDPVGFWVLPGEKEIPERILKEYPERIRIENSWNLNISQDHTKYTRKARRWAATYNRSMSELLTRVESNQPEVATP